MVQATRQFSTPRAPRASTLTEPDSEIIAAGLASLTMLKRAETLEDIGNVAVFAGSDLARSITGTALNITYGRMAD